MVLWFELHPGNKEIVFTHTAQSAISSPVIRVIVLLLYSVYAYNLTIANAPILCLLPIQIFATARIGSKRSIPVKGDLGHVLRGQMFNYLLCCKKT